MIERFNDIETRSSGVIYDSTFEQIKQMYEVDPEQAGELAISAIELILTGDISSDDYIIRMMLTPTKKINEINVAKYETRKETAKQKKIVDMKLDKIADLYLKGFKQREIAERLGLTQQTVSYRIDVIKKKYPELLQKNDENSTKKVDVYQNTNNGNLVNTQEDIFTKKPNVYQNTNVTKNENLVKENVCKNTSVEGETGEETDWKDKFSF